jgi:hypothetical protein
MKKGNSSKKAKKDKNESENPYTSLSLKRHYLETIQKFCDNNHISRDDFFSDLIELLVKPDMTFANLNDRYNNSQIVKMIQDKFLEIISILTKNYIDLQKRVEKNNENNLNLSKEVATNVLNVKKKEAVLDEQNFILNRGLVKSLIKKEDADILLNETLLAVEEFEKEQKEAQKKVIELKKEKQEEVVKEYIYIQGAVRVEPAIGYVTFQDRSRKVSNCRFPLAVKSDNSTSVIWHYIDLRPAVITAYKKDLLTEENIETFISKIRTGDSLTFKGYITDTNKEQAYVGFRATELIQHTPNPFYAEREKWLSA